MGNILKSLLRYWWELIWVNIWNIDHFIVAWLLEGISFIHIIDIFFDELVTQIC